MLFFLVLSRRLDALGFRLFHLNWARAKSNQLTQRQGEGARYPPLDAIPPSALAHDLADAHALRERKLNCPLPVELRMRWVPWGFLGLHLCGTLALVRGSVRGFMS
jgi:hypothetical protein